MKILFLAAEVGPFVSVGGLSQVMYFLPKALSEQGNEVAIFTPKFGAMDETASSKKGWKLHQELGGLRVPLGDSPGEDDLICNVKSYQKSKGGVKTYFLENQEYYELRANVYGYKDDHKRFMLMCHGCLEWLLKQSKIPGGWMPEFIHCNDWHSGYFIEMARKWPRYREMMRKITIGLTIHNFLHQGNFEFRYCAKEDIDDGNTPLLKMMDDNLIKQNPMLRAIKYADVVTTVSPTHAREVLTPEYGEGLENVLQVERGKLSGIMNGIDIKEFDPATDPLIEQHYTGKTYVAARLTNKKDLQSEFGLPNKPDSFLVAYSGRLANQKGLSLIVEAMTHLLSEYSTIQLIVLGGGDDSVRKSLEELQTLYPKQVGLHLLPNFQLPRKIFAGADALLIPSMFEPGGIVALEAIRYGAVPIVRRTGGLNDVISDFDPKTGKGNGFSFVSKDGWGLYGAIICAMTTYKNQQLWKKLVSNCLKENFSWEDVAKKYHLWYKRASETRRRMLAQSPHRAYKRALQVTAD